MDASKYPLAKQRIVGIATDRYLTPTHGFIDSDLPGAPVLKFGQDVEFGTARAAPLGHNVGSTEAVLKPKMEKLLGIFAHSDKAGMAKTLFNSFLAKKTSVHWWSLSTYREAVAKHANINFFGSAAVSAPTSTHKSVGKTRIHQALQAAGWDIMKTKVVTDLGVPALNLGSKARRTEDFGNGLGLMANGLQYAYIIATHYHHDPLEGRYVLRLKYVFYDVFGLDDDDLREYGAMEDGWFNTDAGVGITAWWQLQHQHGYAPLITWAACSMDHEAPAV